MSSSFAGTTLTTVVTDEPRKIQFPISNEDANAKEVQLACARGHSLEVFDVPFTVNAEVDSDDERARALSRSLDWSPYSEYPGTSTHLKELHEILKKANWPTCQCFESCLHHHCKSRIVPVRLEMWTKLTNTQANGIDPSGRHLDISSLRYSKAFMDGLLMGSRSDGDKHKEFMLAIERLMGNREREGDTDLISELSLQERQEDFIDEMNGSFAMGVIATMRYAWSSLRIYRGLISLPVIFSKIAAAHRTILKRALQCAKRLDEWMDDHWLDANTTAATEILIIKSSALFWSVHLALLAIDGYRALIAHHSHLEKVSSYYDYRLLAWQMCWRTASPAVYEILSPLLAG